MINYWQSDQFIFMFLLCIGIKGVCFLSKIYDDLLILITFVGQRWGNIWSTNVYFNSYKVSIKLITDANGVLFSYLGTVDTTKF